MNKFYMRQEQLTYDDVLIVPTKTSVKSRQDVDLSVNIGSVKMTYPIMSAAMDSVTGEEMTSALSDFARDGKNQYDDGLIGIVHRFQSVQDRIDSTTINSCYPVGVAIGLNETDAELENLMVDFQVIAIDVAHAHADYVIERVEHVCKLIDSLSEIMQCVPLVMVGNIVTAQAATELINAGADIIKVGIGGGSACSTRVVTGIGYPNISAIIQVREAIDAHEFGKTVVLVADGGIRNSGDIAKALAAGADCVMLGGLLAGCNESPGKLRLNHDGSAYMKEFRGMASKEAQEDWKGGLKEWTVAEGVSSYIPCTGPVKDVIEKLMGGLRSAFTYADAKNIKEFQENTQFVRVTGNCLSESKPRI